MEGNTARDTAFGWGQLLAGITAAVFLVWGSVVVAGSSRVSLRISRLPGPHHRMRRHSAPPHAVAGATAPIDCAHVACLALTFDDGPSAAVTPKILDVLDRHKDVHATFYVVGSRIAGNEAILRRMYAAGHEIGNHTWSHTDLTTLSAAQVREQITATQAAVAAAGVPLPTTFRPPYGAVNPVVDANVPLTIIRWNVDPEDWGTNVKPQDIISKVEAAARPGRVVELHDIHQPTADALEQLINDLSPNYRLVTVSDLFNLPPGLRGEYFGR